MSKVVILAPERRQLEDGVEIESFWTEKANAPHQPFRRLLLWVHIQSGPVLIKLGLFQDQARAMVGSATYIDPEAPERTNAPEVEELRDGRLMLTQEHIDVFLPKEAGRQLMEVLEQRLRNWPQ